MWIVDLEPVLKHDNFYRMTKEEVIISLTKNTVELKGKVPISHWIELNSQVLCDNCHRSSNVKTPYCPYCGFSME